MDLFIMLSNFLVESNIHAFIISYAASALYENKKKIISNFRGTNSLEWQFYQAIQETFCKFYNDYPPLQFDEQLVMEAFFEAVSKTLEKKELRFDCLMKESIADTIGNGYELGDDQFNEWIRIFQDKCSKYQRLCNKLLLSNAIESQIIGRSRVYILQNISNILKAYLDSGQFDGEDLAWFNDLVFKLDDKFRTSWKDDLIVLLEKVKQCEIDEDFSVKMDYVRSEQPYGNILRTAKELFEKYFWERYDRISLNEQIKYAKFNKAFIITGTEGAGKTFFIRKYVRHALELTSNKEIYVIPCLLQTDKLVSCHDIIDELKYRLNELLCLQTDTISNSISLLRQYNWKICFVIEDVHKIYIENSMQFKKLINMIKEFSKYEEFCWILTVNEYDYYILEQDNEFIKFYSICDNSLIGNKDKESIFSKVFSLSEYNYNEKIISNILINLYNISFVSINTIIGDDEKISHSIETPLEAHLFGQCAPEHKSVEIPNTYLDYIKKITEWKSKEFKDSSINFENVLNVVFNLKVLEFSDEEANESIPEQCLKELREKHLLSVREKINDIFSVKPNTKQYQLRNEVFWAARIVGYAKMISRLSIKELSEFPEKLQSWLIPCYIYSVQFDDIEYNVIFSELFSNNVGYFALFCAKRAEAEYVRALHKYMLEHVNCIRDIKTCFATIYFINYSTVSIADKFKLCNLIADKIIEYKFADIYMTMFSSVTDNFKSVKNLKKSMLNLINCHEKEINVINGYICGRKYYDLAQKEGKDIRRCLKEFVYYIYKHPEAKNEIDISGGDNESFMDFFIRAYFEKYVGTEKNIEVIYEYLLPLFYNDDKFVEIFIRRNFTCAAGNYFSKYGKFTRFYDQYIALVNSLSQKNSRYEKLTALFLIINSREKNDVSPINEELYGILIQLLRNKWINTHYQNQELVKYWIESASKCNN